MKLGTILISVLILFGCATYSITNQTTTKENHDKIEKAKAEFEVTHNRQEEQLKVRPPLIAPIPAAIPAPIRTPNPELRLPQRASVAAIPAPIRTPNSESSTRESTVIIKPEKPVVIEEEKSSVVGRQLFSTQLAFALKENANVDETVKAQLLLSMKEEINTLVSKLTVTGTKTTATINISKVARANLVAPDFKITNVTPEEQIIADNSNTEWGWLLKPLSAGKHEVTLTVTAIITIDGKEKLHHLKKFEKVLTIEVTKEQLLLEWWQANWKWLISTLLIPFLGFLFKEKLKKLLTVK